jgi:hypothetical protein
MAVNGRTTDIGLADIAVVGDRFAVPRASAIVRQVIDAVDSWSEFADEAGVGPAAKDEVGSDITVMSRGLRRHVAA